MSSAHTVDLLDRGKTSRAPATGFWRESHVHYPQQTFDLLRSAKIAVLTISLAISPVTSILDPWLLERRRRDAVVTMSIYQEVLGRFISRSEALAIARQILEEAEVERLAFAEFEAVRGIQWEDQP